MISLLGRDDVSSVFRKANEDICATELKSKIGCLIK